MEHTYSNDELIKLMDAAPLLIQHAIESKETATFISRLGIKNNMSVSAIGEMAKLNVQMLLGLVGPQEFLKELVVSGVLEKDAQGIMTEITQKIFVPLREKMKKEGVEMSQPTQPTPSAPRVPVQAEDVRFMRPTPANPQIRPPQPINAPMPNYASIRSSQSAPVQKPADHDEIEYFHLENKIPLAVQLSPEAIEKAVHEAEVVRKIENEKLLEDHEESSIEFRKTAPPPANLPGVIPEVRPYSNDPYREPIDTP